MARTSLLFVLALGALACQGGVPAPGFTAPFDSVPRAKIRTYLKNLKFDKTRGAGDEKRLVVGCPDACREGPLVAIAPEFRTHRNSAKSLSQGPGRIIAQLINQDDEPYPRYNLGPKDTVYWAVDRVKWDRKKSKGRSLFISAQALRGERDSVPVTQELQIDHYDHRGDERALARWIPDTTGEYHGGMTPGGSVKMDFPQIQLIAWNNCKSGGCCR